MLCIIHNQTQNSQKMSKTEWQTSVFNKLVVTFLTDDNASYGPSFLNMPGLLCKHALAPLQQSDPARHNLTVSQLRTAVVGLGYGYKPTHLRESKEMRTEYRIQRD